MWIEKEQIVGPAPRRALIARRRKAPVYLISDNTERQSRMLQPLCRSIPGVIVNYHNTLESKPILRRSRQRRETMPQVLPGVPVDNNNLERSSHETSCLIPVGSANSRGNRAIVEKKR